MNGLKLFLIILLIFYAPYIYAAVGCTLNDPDRDVVRVFPESTGYRTEFITIKEKGGQKLAERIEEKLNDTLDPTYESMDVPYAYYTVLKGKETVGYIHGVNQKGMYGGMQLILATDLDGKIIDFYYQKISSPEARVFKEEEFTRQFIGLDLEDFFTNAIDNIKDPSTSSTDDFKATVRGVKKNLILLYEFKLENKERGNLEKVN